jgi:5-amino-6-(5-phosphoribosylamino)uracil reductase
MNARTTRRRPARPWTIVHVAISADGKIATEDRKPARFGSRLDHQRLLHVRAVADALLVGASTLTVERMRMRIPRPALVQWRVAHGLSPQPIRAILSGSLSVPPDHPVFQDNDDDVPTAIFAGPRASRTRRRALEAQARVFTWQGQAPDPLWIGAILRREYGVKRLLLEGGGGLNATFFSAGVVDELFMTLCPVLAGGSDAPTPFDGQGFTADTIRRGRLLECIRHGGEVFLRYRFTSTSRPAVRGLDPPSIRILSLDRSGCRR